MKLKLTVDQFLDLTFKQKFFYPDQAEILYNNFLKNEINKLPYVTKKQLKILRKMGCVKI